ncbi:hypothetical protein EV426DRAFT_702014 [Tirmania nivea]|nr:hypothetical protein EV426DRAFT_702014 [Tirmania nivea]
MATKDQLAVDILHALADISRSPFTNATAIKAVKNSLGLSQNTYRDRVGATIYGELSPASTDTTNRYKVLTMAYAVSKTGNSGYDYSGLTKADTSPPLEEKLAVEARRIAVPLYRNYLEAGLTVMKIDFLSLFNDVEFCQSFAHRILDQAFINDQLIAIYAGGTKDYAQSVAYIYERIRPTLLQAHPEIGKKTAADHWGPTAEQHEAFEGKPQDLEEFRQKSLPLEWSDEELLQPPSFTSIGDSFNSEFIRAQDIHDIAQNATSAKSDEFAETGWVVPEGPPPPPPIISTYGKEIVDWINVQADNGYGDVFNHGNAHTSVHYPSIFPSCFAPGTMVRVEYGRDEPIETLKEGARWENYRHVLTIAIGVVSHEQVVAVTGKCGSAQTCFLYGFNDEEPFFTAGHIFFTKAGPKAVNPCAARQENPEIHVQQLLIGDVVFRLSDSIAEQHYEEVRVQSFKMEHAECEAVYGLHFRRGNRADCTYHANGYLVGLNHAETTINRLRENFADMSVKEQRRFVDMIPELPVSLRKLFGSSLVNAFEASFNQPTSQLAAYHDAQKSHHKKRTNKRHIHPASLVRAYPLVHWGRFQNSKVKLESSSPDFKRQIAIINQGERLPVVLVCNGAVIVDGKLVPYAKVDQKEIHWSRPIGELGLWEHGLLHTSADGSFVQGAIAHGEHPEANTHVPSAVPVRVSARRVAEEAVPTHMPHVSLANVTPVFAASHSNGYEVKTTIAGAQGSFAKATDASGVKYPGGFQWGAFHMVEIGLSTTSQGVIQVSVTLPELDKLISDPQDKLYTPPTSAVDSINFVLTVTFAVVAGMEEILNSALTPEADLGPPFFECVMKVNLATNVVTGYYSELKNDPENPAAPWGAGAYRPLYCPYSPKATRARTRALAAIADNQLVEDVSGRPRALALRTNFHSMSKNIHLSPSPAVMTALATTAASANDSLPIAYLQTMSTPADADLHASSQTYMISAAGYWRGSNEIKIFGNDAPGIEKTLPDSLKTQLAADSQAFLRDNFGKHLLIYSLSNHKDYQSKFNDVRKDKLQFWWTGKTDKCLSHMKAYNDLTVITAGQAFLDLADDKFKPYVDSATDYAQRLYTAITDDAILNNLAMSVILGNQNLVNRYCAILNALDKQHRTLDTKLWGLVRDKQIFSLAAGSPEFGDDWSEFAQQYIKILDNKIAHGDSSISEDMRKEMRFDLDKLKAGLDAKDAVDLAFKLFSSTTELGQNILAVMDQFKRRPSRGGQAGAPDFLKKLSDKLDKFPKLKLVFPYLKGIVMVGMQAYTVYQSISFLMKWNELSPAQRAVGILSCVEATLRGIYDLVQTYKEIRNLPPESLDFRIRCVRWSKASAKKVKMGDEQNVEPVLNEKSIAEVPRINNAGEIDPEIPEKSMVQQMGEGGAAAEAEAAENLTKTFSLSSLAVEGVMVALNVATVVMMGMQLKDEWDNVPDGIRAMDTINLIVQCAQVVTGVVGLAVMVAGAEVACIPVIGVLVCIAGLIMTLVEAFVPHPKPDPIQDYLNDHGYSYIDTLDQSPTPELSYTTTQSTSNNKLTIDITITQPANISPAPMISQLLIRVYSGNTSTDAFTPPTTDDSHTVTKDNIVWSIVDDQGTFKVEGANNPDPNDHSLIGRVTPTTKPTGDPDKEPEKVNPGSSVLGTASLKIRIVGTLNPQLKQMQGSVTEVLFNPPKGVAATDVVAKFTVKN